MSRHYLYLGACSEAVLAEPNRVLEHFIAKGSPADVLLHQKCRELDDEGYLIDWACELNEDYFDGELEFNLCWSHTRVASAGNSKGFIDRRTGKVTAGGKVTISYLIAEHAYTDNEDVVEYLMMHEMAHQVEMNHSNRFWKIVARNPNAVTGYTKYHGKSFPVVVHEPFTETYIDPKSRQGAYLASTGYAEGERV